MRVFVRLDPKCIFDIGTRTPDRRMLVKEYVRAISLVLADYAGRPPGYQRSVDDPTLCSWVDGNWRVGYRIGQSADLTDVTICRIELTTGGVGL
jgi:hypothetical protein